jgi:IS5 family transposase
MHLSIESLNILTIISIVKTLTDFALKEEYKRLQLVGDKLAKIDSLIDWKLFLIIFESIYFNKTAS